MTHRRTLIVDDNDTDRMIVKAVLTKIDFNTIHEAENGSVARKKLIMSVDLGTPYDLVMLDWNMPIANGDAILQFVRSHRSLKNTKVVIMTATAERAIVEEAIMMGVDDFIVKPVTFGLLQEKIAKLRI